MPTYIALLRAVNVGNNMLKMERLRALWTELGFQNVRTYVQSGNVVFQAKGAAASWQAKAIAKLAGETRLPVAVLFRTPAELHRVLAGNPFLKEKGIDLARLHVSFLSEKPSAEAWKKLSAIDPGADRFHRADREIYLYCPVGYGTSKLSNARLEKVLGVTATTRNWNTVSKLCAMSAEETG